MLIYRVSESHLIVLIGIGTMTDQMNGMKMMATTIGEAETSLKGKQKT